jgi:hypothetical protein
LLKSIIPNLKFVTLHILLLHTTTPTRAAAKKRVLREGFMSWRVLIGPGSSHFCVPVPERYLTLVRGPSPTSDAQFFQLLGATPYGTVHCRVPPSLSSCSPLWLSTDFSSTSRTVSLSTLSPFLSHPIDHPSFLLLSAHQLSFPKLDAQDLSIHSFLHPTPFTLRYRFSFTIFLRYKVNKSIASRSAITIIYFTALIAIRDICHHIRPPFEKINYNPSQS